MVLVPSELAEKIYVVCAMHTQAWCSFKKRFEIWEKASLSRTFSEVGVKKKENKAGSSGMHSRGSLE